ncbi:MAG: ATP synthase F1 subunit epsilon [Planctomycetota bacterium]
MADSTLHCTVMTPEGKVFEQDVDFVVATAVDGEIGILPKHAPLITALGNGALRARTGNDVEHWLVMGGFLEVLGSEVVVLAHKLEHLSDIDVAQAQKDLEEGRQMGRHVEQHDATSADVSGDLIAAARARINYAKKYGKGS